MSIDTGLDPAYHSQFRQHVHRTYLHTKGIEHGPNALPLPPFYTKDPISYWTSTEKAAFFHGLSVHSRLRPDLIAEDVGTKNVMEVCNYMDRLEGGLRNQLQASGRGARGGRNALEGAVEVSDAWIGWEENQSEAITASEDQWKEFANQNARSQEMVAKRSELLPRMIKGETQPMSEEEKVKRRSEFDAWTEKRNTEWAKEDLWRSIGVPHFKVIDNIFREEEEALAAAAAVADAASNSRQTTAEPPQVLSLYNDMDDSMIDPALRAPSLAAQSSSASVSTSASEPSLETLSPASRKRLRKRLYMRRKRAEAAGELPVQDTAAQTTPAAGVPVEAVHRKKPGRKGRPRKRQKTEEGSVDITNEAIPNDVNDEPDLRHHNVPGKTLHYKIKEQLESMGMDAKALDANGLGLFHLASLARYTRLYVLLDPDTREDIASDMSADFIQFLHAHVVQYVTELMHRCIVSREQERAMKGHTKVWRFDTTNIFPATVEHAREMMGDTRGTRENFFQQLFERLDIDGAESEGSDAEEEAGSGDDQEDAEEVDPQHVSQLRPPSPFSLSQATYSPLIRLPNAQGPSIAHLFDTMHAPEAGNLEFIPSESETEEETALTKILREEEELDAADRAQAEREERVLWAEYGPKRKLGEKIEQVDPTPGSAQPIG